MTTKTGLCLPENPKAFSQKGSHKKMLMRYDIVLQSLAYSRALLSIVRAVMRYSKI